MGLLLLAFATVLARDRDGHSHREANANRAIMLCFMCCLCLLSMVNGWMRVKSIQRRTFLAALAFADNNCTAIMVWSLSASISSTLSSCHVKSPAAAACPLHRLGNNPFTTLPLGSRSIQSDFVMSRGSSSSVGTPRCSCRSGRIPPPVQQNSVLRSESGWRRTQEPALDLPDHLPLGCIFNQARSRVQTR